MEFQNIPINKIKPNPLNPRQIFEGPAFNELVSSIRAKGVLEPIIIRPKKKGYEIVAGERRFRAFSQIAGEDGAGQEIPAIVRKLSDEEAFDIMTIENLHREGLTEAEEAYSFKAYVDKKGKGAIEELAERSGISSRYIRRRVEVLKLPRKILKDWEKGDIAFGVLEQLLRIDPADVESFYKTKLTWARTVEDVKRVIDNMSIPLGCALFKTKDAGCTSCSRNSQVQGSIFGEDFTGEAASCLNTPCFIENQRMFLQENWTKTSYAKKYKANDFLFREEISYGSTSRFWSKSDLFPDCAQCASLVTVLYYNGKVDDELCCSNPSCYNTKLKEKNKASGSTSKTTVDHGTMFRESFYEQRVPEVVRTQYEADDEKILRMNLAALIRSNDAVQHWFTDNIMGKKKHTYYYSYSFEHIWLKVEKMNTPELKHAIREASIVGYFHQYMGSTTRHLMASHLGIDLGRDWLLHEEYLNKKTIKEILIIGKDLGIFADDKAVSYLTDVLKKKADKCKKKELIDLILKSGVDLSGKVPDEIKNVKLVKPEPEETQEEEQEEDQDEEEHEKTEGEEG